MTIAVWSVPRAFQLGSGLPPNLAKSLMLLPYAHYDDDDDCGSSNSDPEARVREAKKLVLFFFFHRQEKMMKVPRQCLFQPRALCICVGRFTFFIFYVQPRQESFSKRLSSPPLSQVVKMLIIPSSLLP